MKIGVTTNFYTYLTTRITKSIVRCWRLTTVNDTVYAFTTHTRNIVFGGTTYESVLGLVASALQSKDNLEPDNVVLSAFLSQQDESLIHSGFFDGAKIELFLVNPYTLSFGKVVVKNGYVGQITRSDGIFEANIQSLSKVLQLKIGRIINPICDARLGDSRCKIEINPIIFTMSINVIDDETLNNTATQNKFDTTIFTPGRSLIATQEGESPVATTVVSCTADILVLADPLASETEQLVKFEISSDFFLQSSVTTVTDQRTLVVSALSSYNDGWFTKGNIKFTSGDNVDIGPRDINLHSQTTLSLYIEFPFPIQAGDSFQLQAGCLKDINTCLNKFDNVVNFRGFPQVPKNGEIFNSPISTGKSAGSTIIGPV